MNTTITYKNNVIDPQTFCDRFEEYLTKGGMQGLDARNRAADLKHFLDSMEV